MAFLVISPVCSGPFGSNLFGIGLFDKGAFFPMVFFKMAFIFNDLFTGVPRALQSGKQEVEKEHSFMTFGLILVIFQD